MNSSRFDNVVYFNLLNIEILSDKELKVYQNGDVLYFNTQTPFTACKVRDLTAQEEFLAGILKLTIANQSYFIWEDSFKNSIIS